MQNRPHPIGRIRAFCLSAVVTQLLILTGKARSQL